jgi:isoamylase
LLLNADSAGHAFALPKPMLDWRLMLDSRHPEAAERPVLDEAVPVAPRGAVLLAARLA